MYLNILDALAHIPAIHSLSRKSASEAQVVIKLVSSFPSEYFVAIIFSVYNFSIGEMIPVLKKWFFAFIPLIESVFMEWNF